MTPGDPSRPVLHGALLSSASWAPTLLVPGKKPEEGGKNPCAVSPAAPSAPSSVKFSELTTTSVNVSWEAPRFPNGVLEGYRLVYEPCTPVDGEWDPRAGLTPTSRGALSAGVPSPSLQSPWPASPGLERGNGGRGREGEF